MIVKRSVGPGFAGALAITLLLAGCSEASDALPRTWHSTNVDPWIELSLQDDGSGTVENFPVWSGSGECVEDNFVDISGPVRWYEGGRGNPMLETAYGDVEIAPAAESFTINWDKLVIVLCRDEARRLVLYADDYGKGS